MFYRWPDIPENGLTRERAEIAAAIAAGLPKAEIVDHDRRFVRFRIPGHDRVFEGDVTQAGVTVYLGGFDWVTYPSPNHILQYFPQYLPLPQQVFRDEPSS